MTTTTTTNPTPLQTPKFDCHHDDNHDTGERRPDPRHGHEGQTLSVRSCHNCGGEYLST